MGFSVSGLASGFDWQSMVEQLREVEEQKVTQLTTVKQNYESKLSAWGTFSGLLSSFQSAASDIKTTSSFRLFGANLTSSSSSVDASSLLSATASSSAAKGTYQVVVNNLATVEKLGSQAYSSESSALGVTGTIIVNGHAVTIDADDSLQDLRTSINQTNTGDEASGVVASIIQEDSDSYRLVLTSETEGADGISLLNGSSGDTLSTLGFNASGTAIKNQVVGAARSDLFSSSSTAVETLLGNSSENLAGTVTLNGTAVSIDLSDSLTTIKDNLVAAGLSARIVTETEGADTYYRLEIEGLTSWTDDSNVLQALGVIEGNRGDTIGVTGGNSNTTDGSTAITDSTLITDIYGYLSYNAGDKITISGTQHDGTAVAATDFAIDASKTVGDLLTEIENAFGSPGDVTASITGDGKIQVVDNLTGASQLSVDLSSTLTGANPGTLDFGTFTDVGTVHRYVLQEGEDASFTVDGMEMTNTSNTVTDAISGVTLNLQGEDSGTTVTVDVDADYDAIEEKVQTMLTAYNDVIDFVNSQMTYDTESGTTGGALFGDNTLKSIKTQLQSVVYSQVGSGEISYLSNIGITVGSDNNLTLDSDTFREQLESNFDDVVKVLSDYGSFDDGDFQYVYNTRDTQAGTYVVDISQAGDTVAGTVNGTVGVGNGEILSIEDSSDPAYGLQIQYTGSSAPASATLTLTRGIASLLEGALDSITDSIDGTVALRENGIQTNIDALEDKISRTEDQIDRKMDLMTTKFQSMEAALSELQSLQSYLTSQLASLSS